MNSENTKTVTRMQEIRQQLSAFSKAVKPLVKEGKFDTVNEGIIETYYKDQDHRYFDTFHGWKAKGKSIVKGAKGFPIWSRPKSVLLSEKGQDANEEDNKRFAVAFLFSNSQVA